VTLPTGETPIGLALGDIHSCALTLAGNVYCWGSNDSNQIGSANVPQSCVFGSGDAGCTGTPIQVGVTGIQHLFAGGSTTCALDGARHVFCWGDNEFGELGTGDDDQYTTPQQLLDSVTGNPYTFDDMAMGRYSACGRDGDNLYCWGSGVLGTQTDGGTPNPYYPALVQF